MAEVAKLSSELFVAYGNHAADQVALLVQSEWKQYCRTGPARFCTSRLGCVEIGLPGFQKVVAYWRPPGASVGNSVQLDQISGIYNYASGIGVEFVVLSDLNCSLSRSPGSAYGYDEGFEEKLDL